MTNSSEFQSATWHNLGDFSDLYDLLELGIVPSEFWLLHCFYIPLRYHGKHFLVLQYPSYARCSAVNEDIRECIWSVPYIAHKLDTGPCKYTVVSHIRSLFEEFLKENADDIENRIEYKFYHMGVSYREAHPAQDLLEVKHSPREPDKWKCYFVKRYVLSDLDVLGRRNLVDPECLMPYRYLCLDEAKSVLETPYPERPYHRIFRGKPLSTNVAYVFVNKEVEGLKGRAIEVSDDDLYYDETGLILSFDLASFGELYYGIEERFRTFNQSGEEIAESFLAFLESTFRKGLDSYRYYEYRIEGDGFLASSPARHYGLGVSETEGDALKQQVRRTLSMVVRILSEINALVKMDDQVLDCRCSLIHDRYLYGKRGGLHAEATSQAGRSLIAITRMQESLRRWYLQRPEASAQGRVFLAVLPEFYETYEDLWEEEGFSPVAEFSSVEKETELTLGILAADSTV